MDKYLNKMLDDSGLGRLNQHAREVGSNFTIIHNSGNQVVANYGCNKCGEKYKYECNFMGEIKWLCQTHADRFKEKNALLPRDLWYVRPI